MTNDSLRQAIAREEAQLADLTHKHKVGGLVAVGTAKPRLCQRLQQVVTTPYCYC